MPLLFHFLSLRFCEGDPSHPGPIVERSQCVPIIAKEESEAHLEETMALCWVGEKPVSKRNEGRSPEEEYLPAIG